MYTSILGDNVVVDPSKTVWVVMAIDRTHVLPQPDGNGKAYWSYSETEVDVVMMSLKKDFKNRSYVKLSLGQALPLIGEKQKELQELWETPVRDIAKAKSLKEKFEIYRKARKKIGVHPLLLDDALRVELQIT